MPSKILLVDDHVMITDSYKLLLTSHFKSDFIIETANTLENAYNFINSIDDCVAFDMVILDIKIAPYAEKNIENGEDLGSIIRSKSPKTKIVFITEASNQAQLIRIINKINPEGLIEKSDVCHVGILNYIISILDGEIIKSKTILKNLETYIHNNVFLDPIGIKIIQLIAQGIKTKNLHQYIPLTTSAIEKRKVKIKVQLNIEKGNDEDLIREARKAGIIL